MNAVSFSGEVDPHRSNPWLFYAIPEILPGIVVISMMTVKKQTATTRKPADEATPLLRQRHDSDETVSPFEGCELRI